MKPLPGYALSTLALGLSACAALQEGQPVTLPGNGPGGRPMATATQQAVGQNPAPDAPVYPVVIALGGGQGAVAESEDAYRWLEALDTPAVKQFVEAQNKVSATPLAALPLRARFQQRAAQISSQIERAPLPPELHAERPGPAGLTARPVAGTSGEWQIVRSSDGQPLAERLHATSVAWAPQGSGLYYGGEAREGRGSAVRLHRMGAAGATDVLVYAPADPAVVPVVDVTQDGRYLVITLTDGPDRSGIVLLDLRQPQARPITLASVSDALYTFIGSSSERLYFLTTRNAPQGRIIAVSAREPLSASMPVVAEGPGRVEHAAFIGNRIVTSVIEEGRSVVRLLGPDGRPQGEVTLPGDGHVEGFAGQSEILFTYSDYLTPPTVYRVDPGSSQARPWSTAQPAINTSAYVTERVYVPGQGSRFLMYVTRRRDRPRDGDQPLVLEGTAQLVPAFNPELLAWLEAGGAYAQVSVIPERRPGLVRESGLDNLQAAAQFLVRERYTRTRRLGLYGRGSSALAAASALMLQPQGYGAVVPALTADAGDDSRPPIETNAPYRRVRKGMCYAPTLITTLDHDSHVAPSVGYQLAAHLQAVQLCSNPVLLRVDARGGTVNSSEISAEHWAFLAEWLGLEPPTG
jgi:prolyl oligopeptidase